MVKITIEILQKIAEDKGGKLLSIKYVHNKSPLLWECSLGHIWEAHANSIKDQKTWCPKCNGTTKLTIEELQKLAISRSGKLLSTKYVNIKEHLLWQCANEHTWHSSADSVKGSGSWCPHCINSYGETLVRECMEQIFQEYFPKKRPEWLINENNNRLELDGFCEKLNLAFEYNGEQHYNSTNIIDQEKVNKIQKHDVIKYKLCEEKGIKVIIVSELEVKNFLNMKEYIRAICESKNVLLPINFDKIKINYNKKYSNPQLEDCKRIALERNGELLSTGYFGQLIPLDIKCNNCNVVFNIKPINLIHKNGWCPHCSAVRKGENNANSKLTENIVKEIKLLLIDGVNQKYLAEKFGVSSGNISAIKNGRSWKDI